MESPGLPKLYLRMGFMIEMAPGTGKVYYSFRSLELDLFKLGICDLFSHGLLNTVIFILIEEILSLPNSMKTSYCFEGLCRGGSPGLQFKD